MGNFKGVVYISNEDFTTLKNNGSVVIDGVTYTYDENILYCTPEEEGEGLPAFDSSKENYVLSVDSSGNLVWRAPYNGEHSNG